MVLFQKSTPESGLFGKVPVQKPRTRGTQVQALRGTFPKVHSTVDIKKKKVIKLKSIIRIMPSQSRQARQQQAILGRRCLRMNHGVCQLGQSILSRAVLKNGEVRMTNLLVHRQRTETALMQQNVPMLIGQK